MASIPFVLRTARATASTFPSRICPSCRTSIRNGSMIIVPGARRTYADDPSPPRTANQLLNALNGSKPSGGSSQPIIPSAAQPQRSNIVPGPSSSIFASSPTSGGPVSPNQPLRMGGRSPGSLRGTNPFLGGNTVFSNRATILDPLDQMFHMHIYSTKHNTHITFTDPKRNAIISCSTGILGFRKAGRHTYDAAYQLAAHVFQKIEEKGLIPKRVEVILRGWGVGREACVKALLGKEGRYLKDVIVRVTDATRTKFGGTRSKKPRRL